jgi:hypothetical protein
MKELKTRKRKLVTIVFHGKIIKIVMLSMVMALFLHNSAKAYEGHSQLLRNSTLETAGVDKNLLSMANIKETAKSLNDAQIKKKAKELEGVFLSVMLEPMFPDGKESDLYGGGVGSDVFRTLMIQEYGDIFANAGGIGLSKSIEKQMNQHKGE